MLIHSGHFYGTPSSPLLLKGAPDYSTDTVSEFHAEAHRQLQVRDLPKVPTWRLERESNHDPPVESHRLNQCATTSHTAIVISHFFCYLWLPRQNHPYWPQEKGQTIMHGSFHLTLQSIKTKPDWIERILTISHKTVSA